jgi:hypothetical protein
LTITNVRSIFELLPMNGCLDIKVGNQPAHHKPEQDTLQLKQRLWQANPPA